MRDLLMEKGNETPAEGGPSCPELAPVCAEPSLGGDGVDHQDGQAHGVSTKGGGVVVGRVHGWVAKSHRVWAPARAIRQEL